MKKHPHLSASDWANWVGLGAGVGAIVLWLVAGSPIQETTAQPEIGILLVLLLATGIGSAWLAAVLWNFASRHLPPSLCGQLIVSETLFALLYSFAWDRQLPTPAQLCACFLFIIGIASTIAAHR
jgi:drug/metabolite transporter (DMT)-like permease